MKTKDIIIILTIVLLSSLFIYMIIPRNADVILEPGIVADNLNVPWSMDFLPDGKLIFTERGGKIKIIDKENVSEIGSILVNEQEESGLLGLAVDPEFDKNRFIYVYYTYDKANRVSRFILNEKMENETIIIDEIPNAKWHDGGRIKFGPDGRLYITTGDAIIPSSAQDTRSLSGKVLRINKDGTIPSNNPFGNEVYSYGHRNPQGLAWLDGQLYASEHGQSSNDEINLITPGANYGWPNECNEEGNYTNPVRCFTEFTLAPSGIAAYNGSIYVAGLRGSQVRKLTIEGNRVVEENVIIDNLGRIRDVVERDGYLYIATNNRDGRGIPKINDDKIIRIKP